MCIYKADNLSPRQTRAVRRRESRKWAGKGGGGSRRADFFHSPLHSKYTLEALALARRIRLYPRVFIKESHFLRWNMTNEAELMLPIRHLVLLSSFVLLLRLETRRRFEYDGVTGFVSFWGAGESSSSSVLLYYICWNVSLLLCKNTIRQIRGRNVRVKELPRKVAQRVWWTFHHLSKLFTPKRSLKFETRAKS